MLEVELDPEIENPLQPAAHPPAPSLRRRELPLDHLHQLRLEREERLHHGGVESLLSAEVVVEAPQWNAGAFTDGARGGGVEAEPGEQLGGGLQDPLADLRLSRMGIAAPCGGLRGHLTKFH